MHAVKMTDGSDFSIEGLGAPWGGPVNGRDLAAEKFSPRTDFALDWFAERPLLYQHGTAAGTGTSVVGRVKAWEIQADAGLWVQAQLDASHAYFEDIKELIGQNKLYFSSGAMAHLVDVDRRSGEIKRWPWVELSLTPTPCNILAELHEVKAHLKAIGVDLPDEAAHDGIKAVAVPQAEPADESWYLHAAKGLHIGLYRDATGTIDGTLLQTAIAEVRAADLPTPIKVEALAQAERIAADLGLQAVVTLTGADATKATWTQKYIDALPDSAFLYVAPGGEKTDGTTEPLSLRHFPYKDKDNAIDLPHLRNALARIPDASLPADVKQRVAEKARRIASANGIGEEEAAKALRGTLKAVDANAEGSSGYDGSYEDKIDALCALLNPCTPWSPPGWTNILATFDTYLICERCSPEDGQTYWHVFYSINDAGEPELGTVTQVERTYVPMKSRAAIGPMTLDASALGEHATALVRRTQGLHERRIKEGRVFSAANQRMLGETADTLERATTDLRTLVDANQRTVDEAAKAAYANSPEARARVLKLLELSIH